MVKGINIIEIRDICIKSSKNARLYALQHLLPLHKSLSLPLLEWLLHVLMTNSPIRSLIF